MRFPFLLASVLAALALGAAPQAGAAGTPPDPGRIAEVALGELPGVVSVGVLRGGRIELAVRRRDGYGQAMQTIDVARQPAAEPIFEIGSVSKVFTGLLVAQGVERSQWRLDDSIGDLLQGRVQFRYEMVSTIQLRQLLTHTACLQRWPAAFKPGTFFEQATAYGAHGLWSGLSSHVLGRSPPCETIYSNLGFAVLGQTLAERAGRTWESLVVAGIAQPLALHDTREHLSAAQRGRVAPPWRGVSRSGPWDAGVFAPAGGLRSTASDLLRFSQALMQGPKGPLGPAAQRLVTDLGPFGEDGLRIGYGVLLGQQPERIWLHNGETRAYLTEWVVWPARQEAVVILASNKSAPTRSVRLSLVAGTFSDQVQEQVYTRGQFRGVFEEEGGRRVYARLKLVTGQKLPFTTLSYRVRDRRLVQGIQEGTEVDFRAERIDGENTLTALRPASP